MLDFIFELHFHSSQFLTSFALPLYLCSSHSPLFSHPPLLTPVHPLSVNWNPTLAAQRWDPKAGLLQQPQGYSALTSLMSCHLSSAPVGATGRESPALASFPQQHLACQQPQRDHHRSCPPAFPSQAFWSSSEQLHANFAVFK